METQKLTARQERFCQEYLISLNATDAARKAGYSLSAAKRASTDLLIKPHISEKISFLQQKVAKKLELKAETVLSELARAAFANISTFATTDGKRVIVKDQRGMAPEQVSCLCNIEERIYKHGRTVKVKMADKLKALELLGKHLGIFNADASHDTVNITVVRKGSPEAKALMELRDLEARRQGIPVDGDTNL